MLKIFQLFLCLWNVFYSIPDLIKKCTDTYTLFQEAKRTIDARIISKLFAFYGTGRFITVPTTAQTQPSPHTSHSYYKTGCLIILQCTVPVSRSLYLVLPLEASNQNSVRTSQRTVQLLRPA